MYATEATPNSPYGEYTATEPAPMWTPADWDKNTWEEWVGTKIQENLNITQQAREDFDSSTQQYHSEENPLRSMEPFMCLMRRLGFNGEAKHHNENMGIP